MSNHPHRNHRSGSPRQNPRGMSRRESNQQQMVMATSSHPGARLVTAPIEVLVDPLGRPLLLQRDDGNPRRRQTVDGGDARGMEQQDDRPSKERLDEAELSKDPVRAIMARIATDTVHVIKEVQEYTTRDKLVHKLEPMIKAMSTKYYSPDDKRLLWETLPALPVTKFTDFDVQERSTLEASRDWAARGAQVGILNFASATKRGGGFKSGAQAQEESLARASTLYLSLIDPDASAFYETHLKDRKEGFYSHSMIYTQGVTLIRDPQDEWATPLQCNIVTCAAVNAGVVRTRFNRRTERQVEGMIKEAMVDRMGMILKLFKLRGDKVLILGSFGTGVFRNSVELVARIWAYLLGPGGRFADSFDHVEFAIIGRQTYEEFRRYYVEECTRRFEKGSEAAKNERSDSGGPS